MALTPGTTLGSYAVVGLIGQGGMGEVYRARDTKLDRDVALKVLPQAFTDDPDRLARFEREAKVLASLNHPNIGHIYGLEEAEGQKALVLELVEGPTLAERIKQGPIPVDEALPIAKQIAEALEAAHEAGVIHRDLKPANIKVREDGTVKVLDFGLAKAFQPDASDVSASMSPTISLTAAATQMGMVIGTAAYMSPEQARGKPVDKRADVWAFGAVLYEMLTGRRAFHAEDMSLTLARVLDREPEWELLNAEIPPALLVFIKRCLQKDAKERIRDIGDVRLAIAGAFDLPAQELAAPGVVPPSPAWQRPTAVALLAAVVTGLAVWAVMRVESVPPSDLIRFAIVPPDSAPLGQGSLARELAISPDGTQVLYWSPGADLGAAQLYLRPLDQLEGGPLRGSEEGFGPFFSPDGEWVGFTDGTATILQKVSVFGGPPVTLTEMPSPISASWGADDQIVMGQANGGLFRVSAGGGEPQALTSLDADQQETAHSQPFIIPDRNAVLFTIGTGGAFARLATGQLAVLDLDTGEVTRLGVAGVSPHYVSTGHVVYASEDASVRAVTFDVTSLEVTGNAVPLLEGVKIQAVGTANFDISDNGRLVYLLGAGAGSSERTLVWVDRERREEPIAMRPRPYYAARLSPDGTRIAVEVRDENTDIWVHDLARGTQTRLTFDPGGGPLPCVDS